MNELKQRTVFAQFDDILEMNGITRAQDIFKLLNDYQNTKLDNIEKANNESNRIALQRSLNYFDLDFTPRFKKFKKKEEHIFKIVNSLVLEIPSEFYKDICLNTRYKFDQAVEHKETILKQKNWYLSTIPESEWLIKYLEEGEK